MDCGELLVYTHYTHLNILGSFLLNDSPKNDAVDDDDDNNINEYCYCYSYSNYIDIISNENTDEEGYNNENNENNENNNEEKEYKLIKDQRDLGFVMLSNPEKVSTHLKKTKFCQVLIDKGHCSRSVCNFAHSIDEIIFPECAFRDNCRKKHLCKFKHPSETNDEYKKRIKFSIPSNIKI